MPSETPGSGERDAFGEEGCETLVGKDLTLSDPALPQRMRPFPSPVRGTPWAVHARRWPGPNAGHETGHKRRPTVGDTLTRSVMLTWPGELTAVRPGTSRGRSDDDSDGSGP